MLNHVLIDPSSPYLLIAHVYGFWLHKKKGLAESHSQFYILTRMVHVRTKRKRGDSSLILWLSIGYTPFSFTDRQSISSASCCYNNRPVSQRFCTFPWGIQTHTRATCIFEFNQRIHLN